MYLSTQASCEVQKWNTNSTSVSEGEGLGKAPGDHKGNFEPYEELREVLRTRCFLKGPYQPHHPFPSSPGNTSYTHPFTF